MVEWGEKIVTKVLTTVVSLSQTRSKNYKEIAPRLDLIVKHGQSYPFIANPSCSLGSPTYTEQWRELDASRIPSVKEFYEVHFSKVSRT